MKTVKRTVSIFLVVLMLLTVAPLAGFVGVEVAPKAKAYNVGDTIQFGAYPQKQVTDTVLLSKLNEKGGAPTGSEWKSYGYYINKVQSDFMKYTDVVYKKEKYRGVYFTQYRSRYTDKDSSTSNQDDNGYFINTIYWFKYEPLTWRILDPSVGILLCTNIIDSQPFQNYWYYLNNNYWTDNTMKHYANSFSHSYIRNWLNNQFYNAAFNEKEKNEIIEDFITSFCSSTAGTYDVSQYINFSTDKIWLLSYDEACNSSYGFSNSTDACENRQATGTDYAFCQGVWSNANNENKGKADWQLRSPGGFGCFVDYISARGFATSSLSLNELKGIRPAIRVKDLDIIEWLASTNQKNFQEKSYIADIWLDQRDDIDSTRESVWLKDFLNYTSVSGAIARMAQVSPNFTNALASWKAFELVFDPDDTTKDMTFGMTEIYEAFIFDLLEKSAEGDNTKNIILKAVDCVGEAGDMLEPYYTFIADVCTAIGGSADVVRNLYVEGWHDSKITVDALMKMDSIKTISDKIGDNLAMQYLGLFIEESETIADFFQMITGFQLAYDMAEEMKTLLIEMKAKTTDIYFSTALDNVISAIGNANWASFIITTRFAEDTALNVAGELIKFAQQSNIYTAVLRMGYDAGKIISNVLANTDRIIDQYYECVAMTKFVDASKKAIVSLANRYLKSGSETDAGAYVYAMRLYKEIYLADLSCATALAKASTDEGLINCVGKTFDTAWNWIQGKESPKTTYEEMSEDLEQITQNLTFIFDDITSSWKYDEQYLKEDYPQIYGLYVAEGLQDEHFAPRILSTSITKDGKAKVSWVLPSYYQEKESGLYHASTLGGKIDGVLIQQESSFGNLNSEIEVIPSYDNTSTIMDMRLEMVHSGSFSALSNPYAFPRTFSISAYTTTTGNKLFTPVSKREMDAPLEHPGIGVMNHGGKVMLYIYDSTSKKYDNIKYSIYRSVDDGSKTLLAVVPRSMSFNGNLTLYNDQTAVRGHKYKYTVKSTMCFTDGRELSLFGYEPFSIESVTMLDYGSQTFIREIEAVYRDVTERIPTKAKSSGINKGDENTKTASGVYLSWKLDEEVTENALINYRVYRKPTNGMFYKSVVTLSSDNTAYLDRNVLAGETYDYMLVPIYHRTGSVESLLTSIYDPDNMPQTQVEIPIPHEHTYSSTVTKQATCTEDGVMTYCCDCGDAYNETIPALGHTDDNNDGHCDNCGEQMTGGDHCKFCGKIHNGGFFDKLTGFFHKIFAIFKR